jgi:hypothetical protein
MCLVYDCGRIEPDLCVCMDGIGSICRVNITGFLVMVLNAMNGKMAMKSSI